MILAITFRVQQNISTFNLGHIFQKLVPRWKYGLFIEWLCSCCVLMILPGRERRETSAQTNILKKDFLGILFHSLTHKHSHTTHTRICNFSYSFFLSLSFTFTHTHTNAPSLSFFLSLSSLITPTNPNKHQRQAHQTHMPTHTHTGYLTHMNNLTCISWSVFYIISDSGLTKYKKKHLVGYLY